MSFRYTPNPYASWDPESFPIGIISLSKTLFYRHNITLRKHFQSKYQGYRGHHSFQQENKKTRPNAQYEDENSYSKNQS